MKRGKYKIIIKLKHGGYELPFDTSDGLRYKPFTEFLREEFGIASRVASILLDRDIIKELARGNYVIASVSPLIRNPEQKPRKKGGHLVLVKGYSLKDRFLVVHNPSGSFGKTQENAKISFKEFDKYFAHRGIIVEGK